ncbi:putative lipoprotein [Campylobacter jejuni subsp. doylei]|nr:putative lipoprotein [Campylobacter jejuni subsp. doylei]
MSGGTIETFKNSGTIKSTGTDSHYSSGVKLHYATVKTFENTNTGLISGLFGFITTQGTIETFINKGIIESKGNVMMVTKRLFEFKLLDKMVFLPLTTLSMKELLNQLSNGILIESGNKIELLLTKA